MGIVNPSQGFLPPASPDLMSDVAILVLLAHATLGARTTTNWLGFAADSLDPGCNFQSDSGVREL